MTIYEKLENMDIILSKLSTPLAQYVPVKQVGNLLYISGQLPSKGGNVVYTGKVGKEQTIECGKDAARICAINALTAINSHTSLENVKSIVKVQGYVNCEKNFTDIPLVVNGASELFVDIFGDSGRHTRTAIGVYELPKQATVEIDVIVEII